MSILMLDPTGAPDQMQTHLAPRDGALAGKRLGLLANGKHNADGLLELVGGMLVDRYGMRAPVLINKGDATRPARDEILAELLPQCDLVVTAIGD
jgi:hypothetical protein